MSPSTTQQWTRRIRYSDQHIRVSDADRNAVAEQLGRHYAEGRLDQPEFDERITRTMAAKTRGDLTGLFDDLPDTDAPAGAGPAGPGKPVRPYRARRGGGLVRLVILVAIVALIASAVGHALMSFYVPWFWIAVVATVVLVSRNSRHHHDHQHDHHDH